MRIVDLAVKRPTVALVINLLIIAFGIVSFSRLPLREYPDVDPPVVSVETTYEGASAAVVESRITQIIEEQISGIEGIDYIESKSTDGLSTITIQFDVEQDINESANDVRDRVARSQPNLPDESDPPQVSKVDTNSRPIMWLLLESDSLNQMELSDYADRYLVDRLAIVDGVARVRIGGEKCYAMRIWLDRTAMAAKGVTAGEVEAALRRQNVELPAGRLESKERELTVRVARQFLEPEDFEGLVIRKGTESSYQVVVGDIAKVAIGAEDVRSTLRGNGAPMVGLGVVKQSKANTVAVAKGVRHKVKEMAADLPPGVQLNVSFDSAVFIEESIDEVYFTFFLTMFLVIGIIYLFLGSVRATLIPALTVPVSLLGSFVVLNMFGFSINLLTLLAMVLAIGLVVDDSIVVLENIYSHLEQGKSPLLAALEGTKQVAFAVISTTAVLVAVFAPITFLGGTSGRLFTEFAMAMAGSVCVSSLVALTLAPALGTFILKRDEAKSWLAKKFDSAFAVWQAGYNGKLKGSLRRYRLGFVIIAAAFGLIYAGG